MRAAHHNLPSSWASALINSDKSGLTRDPKDLWEFEQWAMWNPDLLNPASCSENEFIGRWNGQPCSMLTYDYLEK